MTKIEDVARAIYDASYMGVSAYAVPDDRMIKSKEPWETAHQFNRDVSLGLARAAIEAMREPSAEMAEVGLTAAYGEIGHYGLEKDAGATIWQAMIDEILKEQPCPPT